MEQRESTAETKALGLIQEFAKRFRSLDFTLHPSDIPGEAAGKGSNIGWAARKLSEKYPSTLRNNVIVTGIDGTFVPVSDLCLFLTNALFQPTVIFRRTTLQF